MGSKCDAKAEVMVRTEIGVARRVANGASEECKGLHGVEERYNAKGWGRRQEVEGKGTTAFACDRLSTMALRGEGPSRKVKRKQSRGGGQRRGIERIERQNERTRDKTRKRERGDEKGGGRNEA